MKKVYYICRRKQKKSRSMWVNKWSTEEKNKRNFTERLHGGVNQIIQDPQRGCIFENSGMAVREPLQCGILVSDIQYGTAD